MFGTARPSSTSAVVSSSITPSTGNAYCSASSSDAATRPRRPNQIGCRSNGAPTGIERNVCSRIRSTSWCRSKCRISRKANTWNSCDITDDSLPLSGSSARAIENPISVLTISPAATATVVMISTANPSATPTTASRTAMTPSASTLPGSGTCCWPTHQNTTAIVNASTRRRNIESRWRPNTGTTAMNAEVRTRCRNSDVANAGSAVSIGGGSRCSAGAAELGQVLVQRRGELAQRAEDPRQQQQQRGDHCQHLRHDRQRLFLQRRHGLEEADQQADDHADQQRRCDQQQRRGQRRLAQVHQQVLVHVRNLTWQNSRPAN